MADVFSPKTIAQGVISSVRRDLFVKGMLGLGRLLQVFSLADPGGLGYIDKEEMAEALSHIGVFLTQHEMSALSKVYDPSGHDHVDYHRFVDDLNAGLNQRRQALVDKAFDKCLHDSAGQQASPSGTLGAKSKFLDCFNPQLAPDVKAGRADAANISHHFVNQLSDTFSKSDWTRILSDFGAAIPSDEYFVDFMESCFGVKETEADAKTEEKVQFYVEIIKDKCRQKRKPRENEPQRLLRAFRYFDDTLVGHVALPEFRKVLAQLGVPLSLGECTIIYNKYPHTSDGNFDYVQFVDILYAGELI